MFGPEFERVPLEVELLQVETPYFTYTSLKSSAKKDYFTITRGASDFSPRTSSKTTSPIEAGCRTESHIVCSTLRPSNHLCLSLWILRPRRERRLRMRTISSRIRSISSPISKKPHQRFFIVKFAKLLGLEITWLVDDVAPHFHALPALGTISDKLVHFLSTHGRLAVRGGVR